MDSPGAGQREQQNTRRKYPVTEPRMARPVSGRFACCKKETSGSLLEFDLGASVFELLLERLGVGFADTFLDGLRRTVNQILGFLEA